MKRFIFAFFVLSFIFAINVFAYSQELLEITLPLSQNLEEEDWLLFQIRDVFSEKVRELTSYVPTSSADIEKQIIALQKKSENASFDESSAIEMGKLVSAKYALFSAVRKAKEEYFLSATIADLTTGKTLANATSSAKSSATALFSGEKSAIDEIMSKICSQLGIKSEKTDVVIASEKPLTATQKKEEAEKKEKNFIEMKFRHTDSLLTQYTASDEVVVIPDFIYKIGFAAFRQARNMKKVVFHSLVSEIGRESFAGTGLTEIEIPNTVLKMEKKAFFGCLYLKSATIPASVKVIAEQCFSGCTRLEKVEIASGITRLEKSAFTGCTSLSRLVIPESVDYIGDFCFSGCTSLKEVIIKNPSCVIGNKAFYGTHCVILQE